MRNTAMIGLAAAAFWTAAPDPARAEYWYALGPYRCHRALSEHTDWLRYELIGSGGI